jgi:hypothetical protein
LLLPRTIRRGSRRGRQRKGPASPRLRRRRGMPEQSFASRSWGMLGRNRDVGEAIHADRSTLLRGSRATLALQPSSGRSHGVVVARIKSGPRRGDYSMPSTTSALEATVRIRERGARRKRGAAWEADTLPTELLPRGAATFYRGADPSPTGRRSTPASEHGGQASAGPRPPRRGTPPSGNGSPDG